MRRKYRTRPQAGLITLNAKLASAPRDVLLGILCHEAGNVATRLLRAKTRARPQPEHRRSVHAEALAGRLGHGFKSFCRFKLVLPFEPEPLRCGMYSKVSFFRLSCGLAVLCFASATLSAQITNPGNLVANASFESPALPTGANHVVPASDFLPWQTTENAFLVWASELPNESPVDGRQHLEVVTVWQTMPTISGQDYSLSFFHCPRPRVDSTLNVEINGHLVRTFAENGAALAGFNWRRFGTNFTATSNATTIRFNGVGIAGNAHIDAVTLERLPASSTLRVSEVELCWETVATKVYQVQSRPALPTSLWTNWDGPVQGNGATSCIRDAVPAGEPQRFYRVTIVP